MNDVTFENLEVWKDALELAAQVFGRFRQCRDHGLGDQIRRAVVSISSNIAEGYERDSNAELIRYLFIAKASCGEVRSQLHLAARVKILSEDEAYPLITFSARLSRRLQRLIDVRRQNFS